MKKIILVLISLFVINLIQAQQKAVTETGEEVILYHDGTWKFMNEIQPSESEIPTNLNKFSKDEGSTFLLKSSRLNVGFWLNPKIWTFTKAVINKDGEFDLKYKDGDLYGMIITEKFEIPLESLRSIAVTNGQKVAPDLKIVKEEYRTVNGLKILLIQMNGTLKGIKFSYYGYYYSCPSGTVQFMTYTSKNLIESYIPKIELLLNGLVELN